MANKRQRLAKQRFLGTQQGLASQTPQKANPHAQAAVAIGHATKKALKATSASRKISKKHPLRVPGSKPGEGCFICKATDHVAKGCPQKSGKERKMICLLCRKLGHTVKTCPSKSEKEEKKCYNCGSSGHRLADCKEPLKNGGTTFASCFLCKEEGHLSKNCPTNLHGIYPKGGCCKICGGVTHLAKDCPKKGSTARSDGVQRSNMSISTEVAPTSGDYAKRIVFGSGDDLEDDFVGKKDDKDEKGVERLKLIGRSREMKFGRRDYSSSKPFVRKAKSSKVVNFK